MPECPSKSCSTRRSVPPECICVAKSCRNTCCKSRTGLGSPSAVAGDLVSLAKSPQIGLGLICHISTGGIAPLEEEQRREQAISYAQQAIELDPLDPQGHWLLGMFLQMRRDFAGARLHLDRAVMLSPGDVETLGYTGLEYAYAGDPSRGIEQAERSVRLNPCYPAV
jgi:tetratricopeptide repeat protein